MIALSTPFLYVYFHFETQKRVLLCSSSSNPLTHTTLHVVVAHPCSREFETIVEGLSDALDFSRTIGVDSSASYERGGGRGTVGEVDFYTR